VTRRTAKQRRDVAYHEAGHAVVAWLSGLPFGAITIVPKLDTMTAGSIDSPWYRQQTDNPRPPQFSCKCGLVLNVAPIIAAAIPDSDLRSDDDHGILNICVSYAGGEVTRILTGRLTGGEGSDYRDLGDIAEHCWPYHSDATRRALLRGLRLHTHDLLRDRWALVEALATAVLTRRKMTERQATAVLRRAWSMDWTRSLKVPAAKDGATGTGQ